MVELFRCSYTARLKSSTMPPFNELDCALVPAWFADVYHMPISLGSVSNVEHTVGQSLVRAHEDIKNQVQDSPVIHLDETGHKECYQNGWAWIMSTQDATYFKIARSRGGNVGKVIISDFKEHVYVKDRYSAYDFLPDKYRQICWTDFMILI